MPIPLVKIGRLRLNLLNVTHLVEADKGLYIHYVSGQYSHITNLDEMDVVLQWYDKEATDLTPSREPGTAVSNQPTVEERAPLDLGD